MYEHGQQQLGEQKGREMVGDELAVGADGEWERVVTHARLVLHRRVHQSVHRAPTAGHLECPHEGTHRIQVIRVERHALHEASAGALRLAP